jgi:hypothetical protein
MVVNGMDDIGAGIVIIKTSGGVKGNNYFI